SRNFPGPPPASIARVKSSSARLTFRVSIEARTSRIKSEIWRADSHDSDFILEVLASMETLNVNRALEDFTRAIDAVDGPEKFRDEQFEVMVLAFVRAEHSKALDSLRALKERASSFVMDDADEHRELIGFIDEGIALVSGSTQ
ncbi:MAG: hypothetical protein AAFQ82_01425, partial [Myxococcota bacterium]